MKMSEARKVATAALSRISNSRKSQKDFHRLFAESMARDPESEWKRNVESAIEMLQQRLDKLESGT